MALLASVPNAVQDVSFEGDSPLDAAKLKTAQINKNLPQNGTAVVSESQSSLTMEKIKLDKLPEAKRHLVRTMLEKYSSMWKVQFGEVKRAQNRIDLAPGARPVYSQPYRTGPQSRQIIQQNIEEMKSQGVIETSNSDCASPVVLVPRYVGSLRFFIEYRRLNALTVKDSYQLQNMDDCLNSLGTAAYFSTLD